jgi:hypothetical protein
VIDKPLPCRFSPTKLPRKPFSVFPDLRDLCVLRARPPFAGERNVAGDSLGYLQSPTVLQVVRDAGRSERVRGIIAHDAGVSGYRVGSVQTRWGCNPSASASSRNAVPEPVVLLSRKTIAFFMT